MSQPVVCNHCKVDDATVVFPAGVAQINQIVKCNRCGLMYASPRAKEPDHVEIAAYDPNYNPLAPRNTRVLKEQIQVRDYDKTRALLNRIYPQRGKLVEVGSSLGYLLDVFRKDGWDVLGVEPFYQACRYAREELGLDVKNAILETADLPDESADVVLLNHVIEHLDDPLQTLCEVNRLLKPGGHFVIETPRYDTLSFKLLGRRERSVSCGGHIYFYTTDSLKKLYEIAGFKAVKLDYVGRSLTGERLLYNVGVMSKSLKVRKALERFSNRAHLDRLKLRLNFRDMQRVCVRKVASAAPALHSAGSDAGATAVADGSALA
jgi:SAM-dependent methyltransferase